MRPRGSPVCLVTDFLFKNPPGNNRRHLIMMQVAYFSNNYSLQRWMSVLRCRFCPVCRSPSSLKPAALVLITSRRRLYRGLLHRQRSAEKSLINAGRAEVSGWRQKAPLRLRNQAWSEPRLAPTTPAETDVGLCCVVV